MRLPLGPAPLSAVSLRLLKSTRLCLHLRAVGKSQASSEMAPRKTLYVGNSELLRGRPPCIFLCLHFFGCVGECGATAWPLAALAPQVWQLIWPNVQGQTVTGCNRHTETGKERTEREENKMDMAHKTPFLRGHGDFFVG